MVTPKERHHDPPTICGPINDPDIMNETTGGLKGHLTRELTKSGELTGEPDPGSWFWPYKSANAIHTLLKNEPKYLKLYGPVPTLRYGGPKYNQEGFFKE